jgi:hypothetical protein
MISSWRADGPVNKLLLLSKAIGQASGLLGNPKLAIGSVIVISAGRNLGTNIVYWLAACRESPTNSTRRPRWMGAAVAACSPAHHPAPDTSPGGRSSRSSSHRIPQACDLIRR